MKSDVIPLPVMCSVQKSHAKALRIRLMRLLGAFLFVASLAPAGAKAAGLKSTLTAIQHLAEKPGITASGYASRVAAYVKADPKDAAEIIEEAIADDPAFAQEVIKESIAALTPPGTSPDPNVIGSTIASVVEMLAPLHPDLLASVVEYAKEAAPDAAPEIQADVAAVVASLQAQGLLGGIKPNQILGSVLSGTISPTPSPSPAPSPNSSMTSSTNS